MMLRLVAAVVLVLLVLSSTGLAQNPTPFIDSLSNITAYPGTGQSEPLTITGSGFAPGATVNFDGLSLKPSSVTSTSIQVRIPAISLTMNNTVAIAVVNPNSSPYQGISNPVTFLVTGPPEVLRHYGIPTTIDSLSSTVAGEPRGVITADFNADGNADVAAVTCPDDSCQNGKLTILLGDGAGSLKIASSVEVGASPDALVTGDFNADGNLDLAVVNRCGMDQTCNSAGTVTILQGDGRGNFKVFSTAVTGFSPRSIVAGDFNRDGYLDLAVPNQCGSDPSCANNGTVSILLGDGRGHFQLDSSPSAESSPSGLTIGDFNRDGNLDLAAMNVCGASPVCDPAIPGTLTILFGDGQGKFALKQSLTPGGFGAAAIAAGDFNADGNLDIVVAQTCNSFPCGPSGLLTTLLGDGTGKFKSTADVLSASDTTSDPLSIVTGDFNGDGSLDVVLSAVDGFSFHGGDGTGRFPLRLVGYSGPPTSSGLASADFDNDGILDIVTSAGASNAVTVSLVLTPRSSPVSCGPFSTIYFTPSIAPFLTAYPAGVVTAIPPASWVQAPYTNPLANARFPCDKLAFAGGLSLAYGANSATISNIIMNASQNTLYGDVTYNDPTGATTLQEVPLFKVRLGFQTGFFLVTATRQLVDYLQAYGLAVDPAVVIGELFPKY